MDSSGTFCLGFCLLLLSLSSSNSLKTKSKGSKSIPNNVPVVINYSKNTQNSSSASNTTETENVNSLTSRILQITSPFSTNDVTVLPKPYNSDIIVGQDVVKEARIILECSAPFPVQWIYNGDGMPEISTNTSIGSNNKSVKRSKQNPDHFVASAALGFNRKLQESDTGEYVCRSVQSPENSIYYFIYVPGKSLFTSQKGQILKVSGSQPVPTVRIPCSVTNPEVVVTLQKKVDGILQCPVQSLISFNPKSGFLVQFSGEDDLEDTVTGVLGDYICIGSLNGSFQLLEYPVVASKRHFDGKEIFLAGDSIFREGDDDDSVEAEGREYFSRYDDLCFNTPCGPNSICRKVPGIRLPMCACKSGYSGSPPKCQLSMRNACEPNPCGPNSRCEEIPGKNLPRCSCLPAYIGRPPNCRPECLLNLDCPPTMACVNQQCEDPCDGFCAEGAICRVRNHIAVCSCPPGYSGDPRRSGKCGRNRTPSVTYFPPRPSYPDGVDSSGGATSSESNESNEPDWSVSNKFACDPWPCGPNSQCRPVGENAHCSCTQGYAGRPPNCYRPECQRNSDCPRSTACIEYKCQDLCLSTTFYKCGNRAKCMTVNHNAECYCPSGYKGDPFLKCTPTRPQGSGQIQGQGQGSNEFPESPISSTDQSYPPQNTMRPIIVVSNNGGSRPDSQGSSGRPQSPSNSQQIQTQQPDKSPCRNSPCGKNAVCTYRNETIGCKCPTELAGFGSDPYVECYPSQNPCEQCGPNSECRINKNRQPVCACLPGKIGAPPNCRSNFCGRSKDCLDNQSCHKSKCVDPCRRSDCGENAVCRAMKHLAVCACLNAPDRDPLQGCPPRRSQEFIEFSFENE